MFRENVPEYGACARCGAPRERVDSPEHDVPETEFLVRCPRFAEDVLGRHDLDWYPTGGDVDETDLDGSAP